MPTTLSDVENVQWGIQKRYIPNGTQTFSKMPERFVNGVYPKFIKRASGCTVEDINGKIYTDYISALGAISLGYADKFVDKRVKEQIDEGILYSLPSTKEWCLAKRLNKAIPCAEKSKFFKTGSEAVSAAIRVARAYTKKDKVVVCGYHGWHDWYTISSDNRNGIPVFNKDLISKFEYGNLDQLSQLLHNDVAAVIMEPVQFDEPQGTFLHEVRKLCVDCVLIFDEIITGIRFGVGGAGKFFGVVPDLACFSKALGNGYPIAALVGKAEFMDEFERPGFFVSGTFNGDLIGIEAASAVLDKFNQDDIDEFRGVQKIWTAGEDLKNGFNGIVNDLGLDDIMCVGMPPRTKFVFPTKEMRALFFQECVKSGHLFGPSNFVTASHTRFTIQNTLNAIYDALVIVQHCKDNKDLWCNIMEGSVPDELIIR